MTNQRKGMWGAAMGALWALAFVVSAPQAVASPSYTCQGAIVQGGVLFCRAETRAAGVVVDGVRIPPAPNGWTPIGIRRDATGRLDVFAENGRDLVWSADIEQREFPSTRIEGLAPAKVRPRTAEQQAAVSRSWEIKRAAFENLLTGDDFTGGFIRPAPGRISGVYGSQRVLVVDGRDDPTIRTHWGVDYAAPTGTPVIAPAGGVVTLADPDLYFEGGTVFLDHGQGLVSVFMHLSALDVAVGQRVAQGERIGAVGSTGRSTGPHLHWGVKWRDQFYIDPALVLDLAPLSD